MTTVHVARLGLFTVDANGNRIDKCCAQTSVNDLKNTSLAFLVLPDTNIPNSVGYPTIERYLQLEGQEGYNFRHLDQSFVITGVPELQARPPQFIIDLAELKDLLFSQGQAGGIWVPSLSPTMISSESFGTGVQTFLDLSDNGNNATQASAGNRPAWGRHPVSGIRQLLVNSGFNGAESGSPGTLPTNWTGFNFGGTITVTENSGTLGGNAVEFDVSGDRYQFSQTMTVAASTTYTWSAIVDVTTAGGGSNLNNIFGFNSPPAGAVVTYRLNGNSALGSDLISNGNNQIIECFLAVGATAGTVAARLGVGLLANGTVTLSFCDPQFEVGTTRTTYQRATNRFDITESGQRDCYYLQPDGVDDAMATASIDFSGTDKVTVFAAVRKLSDVSRGTIIELTPQLSSNNGSFYIEGPNVDGSNSYIFAAKGTTTRAVALSSQVAPVTNILTGNADISGPSTQLRNGGSVVGTVTDSLGTGNFANDALYLFSRGGTTLPFNGQCFGLIVAGGSYPLSTIQRVERILSRYTPGVSL